MLLYKLTIKMNTSFEYHCKEIDDFFVTFIKQTSLLSDHERLTAYWKVNLNLWRSELDYAFSCTTFIALIAFMLEYCWRNWFAI